MLVLPFKPELILSRKKSNPNHKKCNNHTTIFRLLLHAAIIVNQTQLLYMELYH